MLTSLGVSNVSFGFGRAAREVLNSVFLHHCVEAGLDLAMVHPKDVTPYSEIPQNERELADDLVFNRREDAPQRFIEHFEEKGESAEDETADPTAGMEPEEALHFHILRRKKEGVEDWIDKSVEKIGAVPTLNDVLLPAMKEVGDKFGAGELILPFVLQSAEVMKKAVARLENYLDRLEGYTKGTVVLATVFGDVHDIGKSLVNTILTNNGYTVVDLGKQVPVSTILEAAQEHRADAIGLSALLVSTSKQMPLAVQELHERKLDYPVLIGGAAINRDFGLRALYPHGRASDDVYEPGVFFCKDAFEGLAKMDQIVDADKRAELVQLTQAAAKRLREKVVVVDDAPPVTDDSVRSAARTDLPVPTPPWWGVRELDVPLDEVWHHIDTHVLFKLHWGGRGVKGDAWTELLRDNFVPRLERMWKEQTYLHPRAKLGYFPCNSEGNELIVFDPEDHDRELHRLVFPRQPKHDRICLADFYRPLSGGEKDVCALQVVTAGDEVTELMARLGGRRRVRRAAVRPRPRRADGRGDGRVGPRESAPRPRHRPRRGPPLLVGLPRLPRPVRAHEGLRPARRRVDRHAPLRRLRRRAGAVDGRDRRAPSAGRLLRHEKRLPAEGQGAGRDHRRQRQGPGPARRRRARRAIRARAPSRPRSRLTRRRPAERQPPAQTVASVGRPPRRAGRFAFLRLGAALRGAVALARMRVQLDRRGLHRAQADVLPGRRPP